MNQSSTAILANSENDVLADLRARVEQLEADRDADRRTFAAGLDQLRDEMGGHGRSLRLLRSRYDMAEHVGFVG